MIKPRTSSSCNISFGASLAPPCPKAGLCDTLPDSYKARMLTALVHANSTPAALAVTLSSLVPAVAEGLVSHAVVMLPGSDAGAERIADAMGATVVVASSQHWQAGARTARGEWVFLLEAGDTPGHGWIAAIERHLLLQSAERQRAAFLPLSGFPGWSETLAVLIAAKSLRAGVILPRRQALEGAGSRRPHRLPVNRERMAP